MRASASLTFVGIMALQVLWTNFFDDYTCVCVDGEESNVSFYVESLFRMLGIWFAETGSKALQYSNRLACSSTSAPCVQAPSR